MRSVISEIIWQPRITRARPILSKSERCASQIIESLGRRMPVSPPRLIMGKVSAQQRIVNFAHRGHIRDVNFAHRGHLRDGATPVAVCRLDPLRLAPFPNRFPSVHLFLREVLERDFFIDNLLVRIHFIIVMIRWTGLAPCAFEFPFPGSLASTFLEKC